MDAYNSKYETDGDYGNYASASGYGYGYMRYVDCNSALALLGFVLFVDLLRDIVETVTTNGGGGGRRMRKRWVSTSGDALVPEMLTFISDGGLRGLNDDLPVVLNALMSTRFEKNGTEEEEEVQQGAPTACLQHRLCSANAQLAGNYGTIGSVLAMLTSNLFAMSMPETSFRNRTHPEASGTGSRHSLVLNAAKQGRLGADCAAFFPSCSSADASGASARADPLPEDERNFDDHPVSEGADSSGDAVGLGGYGGPAAVATQRPSSTSPSSRLQGPGT